MLSHNGVLLSWRKLRISTSWFNFQAIGSIGYDNTVPTKEIVEISGHSNIAKKNIDPKGQQAQVVKQSYSLKTNQKLC